MQLTGELAPLAYAHRETEFIVAPTGPDIGKRIFGACGPTALASCASAALQKLVTTEQVYGLMEPRGLCDASGVSTDGKIATAATSLGLTIAEHRAYSEPWSGWDTFLGWHLGSCDHPTLIEVANDLALHDLISGLGLNAGATGYHFIMLLKRHGGGYSAYAGKTLPSGFWACDGASWAGGNGSANGFNAADVLQFYSDTTIMNARPCAGIAFNRAALTAQTGGSTVAGVPTGWKDDGTTLTAPNGVAVVQGFRQWVLAHNWDANDVPEAPEQGVAQVELGNPGLGGGTIQFFRISGQLSWTQKMSVYQTWNGQELYALHAALSKAQGDASAADAQVSSLQAQVAQLQAQLAAAQAAAQNQPAPAPAPAPLTQQQQNDLAAMAAFRAALA